MEVLRELGAEVKEDTAVEQQDNEEVSPLIQLKGKSKKTIKDFILNVSISCHVLSSCCCLLFID